MKKVDTSIVGELGMQILSEPSSIYISIADTIIKAIMFYTCLYYLIPKFLKSKKYPKFIVSCLLVFCISLGLSIMAEHLISEHFFLHDFFKKSNRFVVNSTVFHFALMSIALGFGFWKNWDKTERQKEELLKESLLSELKLLKSQINPHFLFNTLNNIFALARKSQDPKLAQSLAQLSHLMRYMLNENLNDSVPLEREINYLKDFISLQKLRFTNESNDSVRFEVFGLYEHLQIAPLLLIPFVENAFKFSPSYLNSFEITITVKITESVLNFKVFNTVNENAKDISEGSGLGLKNVKRRLSLLYPEKHTLDIKDDADSYLVNLTLDLSPQ